jgi:hypothetical protein
VSSPVEPVLSLVEPVETQGLRKVTEPSV